MLMTGSTRRACNLPLSKCRNLKIRKQRSGIAMLHPWMMLGMESNRVIGLRLMKLMLGGKSARREARLMVREKVHVGLKANARMMAGASVDELVQLYRRRVAANAKRLSKGPRRSIRKRKRRR